jgi:N-terminal acetyltransferase B complex non-catalytic subunit
MPNDDLMLLAVQQLMHQSNGPTHDSDIVPAVLLEMAIDHSPDNAYLKIAAMEVYHRLNAPTRLWEMFQGIGLKHIQLDSCSFVVLPYMLEGGLYNEAIELSSSLLRFQKSSSRDCEGYAEKAMENGRLSKADEFLAFQRKKLNPSLTFQFCKGLILDSAPLFATALPRKKADDNPLLKGGLGISQGIVGKADDMERAIQMIVEKDNPYAALSVLSWASNGTFVDGDNFSDNRDLSLLTYFKILTKPLVERKDVMLKETLRRGYFHGLVVRAALCVDATKGPKKGKLVKPTEQLTKRTQSLLDSVLSASESLTDIESLDDLYRSLSETLYSLCRFLAIVNAGLPVVNNEDSLPGREERASEMIHEHCRVHLSEALCLLNNSTDLNLIYYIVPSFIVPIFALFRMSANVCDTYGWGKRKAKSKICATAMAAFAADFNQLVQGLIKCVGSLPSSSPPEDLESRSQTIDLTGDETSLLDPTILMSTVKNVQEARYRKRLRIEPILQEMDEYLDEFNFTD